MSGLFRDPAHDAAFAEQGYVVVPLLSPEEAAGYRAEIRALMPPVPAINDPQGAMYNSQFDKACSRACSDLCKTVLASRYEALLRDHRNIGGSVMAKVAGSGRLALHQHQPATPDIYEPVLNCWLTLEDTCQENGALRIVPRSHGITRHIQSHLCEPYFIDFADQLEADYAVTLPMRAGEAILFERTLLHGSWPNGTGEPALRILSTMVGRDSRPCLLVEPEAGIFEAWEPAEAGFNVERLRVAAPTTDGLKKIARLANRNMRLTQTEFDRLMGLGKKIRPGYDPVEEVRADLRRQAARGRVRRVVRRVLRRVAAMRPGGTRDKKTESAE